LGGKEIKVYWNEMMGIFLKKEEFARRPVASYRCARGVNVKSKDENSSNPSPAG